LSLYLDTLCNLDCTFCFLDSGESHRENQMSLDKYRDVIKQGRELGVKSTLFFGAGEPLLDEKLFPLIEYSNEVGLHSVMFTNASLVTREVAERMKQLDLSVVASVKSRNPHILEELTRMQGSAEKIYSGFQHLLDVGLNETEPTRLGNDILICKQVCDEVPELIRYCVNNNIHPMVESLLCRGESAKNWDRLKLSNDKAQKLSIRLREEFPELMGERAYFEGSSCDLDHYTLFVNYNGDVWQCFSRDIVMGNVRDTELERVWNTPQLKALRNSPLGARCSVCPGRRYNLERSGLLGEV